MWETREQFLHYCQEQINSIQVAIRRKSNGSQVEDSYFLEHLEKLKTFFLETQEVVS
jgi:hypothetical protein